MPTARLVSSAQVLFLGIDGAGKTSVLKRLQRHIDVSGITPTVRREHHECEGGRSRCGRAQLRPQLSPRCAHAGRLQLTHPDPREEARPLYLPRHYPVAPLRRTSHVPYASLQRSADPRTPPPTRGDLPLPCCLRGRPYTIWDIGGNSTTRQFWQYYTKGKDALIWVIDSADLDKITEGELELALLLSSAQLARSGARTCHSGEGVRVCGGGWVTFGIVPRTPLANKQAESTRPIHLIREPFRPPPPNVFRRHTRRCWWWRTSRTWAAPYPPRTSHCCCGRC